MKCDICFRETTNFILNILSNRVTGLCKIHYDMNLDWINLKPRKEISKEEYDALMILDS